ncbi:unnamed protein product [Somion occarium]|uniref:Poly A polymerase head domain-containing protein n=1 Tax=Somion occarium TaxID=3059160 RepID=A0ABP1CQ41_9APHY
MLKVYRIPRFFKPVNTRRMSLLRVTTHDRICIPERPEVHLTEVEERICTLLHECTKWMRQTRGDSDATSCRIAGGWVRDKLLGLPCNDIDISLENMMGMAFAQQFIEFCSMNGIETDKLAKIEINPDRSKHLETARTTVLGTELDFVNLRSEEYTEDSRIPTQVAFGTPLQDALRRDITINALFYNVHSRSVEDFTGKGLTDLEHGIIRTPLPPRETFMDDPLRVIRCIRFASRFGFNLHPELQESARDPQIQEALRFKISRERVGVELDKMLKGRDPLLAIRLINELSLYDSLFYIPSSVAPEFSATRAPSVTAVVASSLLHIIIQPLSSPIARLPPVHPTLLNTVSRDYLLHARLHLACFLLPFLNITYKDRKGKPHEAVEAAIREGVKLGTQNHYLNGIPALFAATQLLRNPTIEEQPGNLKERARIGMLLREKLVHNAHTGSHWTSTLLFTLITELVPLYDVSQDVFDIEQAKQYINAYNAFVSRIEDFGLPSAVDAKPLLDVLHITGVTKPGPWTGQVLTRVCEWQLEHPEATEEECENWLRAVHLAGHINMDLPSTFIRPMPIKRGKGTSEDGTRKKPKSDVP